VDLKDFVAGSLTQIIQGIRNAQEESQGSGAWISPAGPDIAHRKETPILETPEGEGYLHEVHFDVAITVSDEQGAKGGAGLKIFGAKLGAEGTVRMLPYLECSSRSLLFGLGRRNRPLRSASRNSDWNESSGVGKKTPRRAH